MSFRVGSYSSAHGKRKKWQMEVLPEVPACKAMPGAKELGGEDGEEGTKKEREGAEKEGQDIEADIMELQKLMKEQKQRKRHRQKHHHHGKMDVGGGEDGGKDGDLEGQSHVIMCKEKEVKGLGVGSSSSKLDQQGGLEDGREQGVGRDLKGVSAGHSDAGTESSRSNSRRRRSSSETSRSSRSISASGGKQRGTRSQGTEREGGKDTALTELSTGDNSSGQGDDGGGADKKRRRRRYDWMDSDDEDITGSSGNEEEEELMLLEAVKLRAAATTTSSVSCSSGAVTTDSAAAIEPDTSSYARSSGGGVDTSSPLPCRITPPHAFSSEDNQIYEDVRCACISNISWDGSLAQLKEFIESYPLLPALKVLNIVKHTQVTTSVGGPAVGHCPPGPFTSGPASSRYGMPSSQPPPPSSAGAHLQPRCSLLPHPHPFGSRLAPPPAGQSGGGGRGGGGVGGGGSSLPLFSKTDHTGRAFVEFQSYEVYTDIFPCSCVCLVPCYSSPVLFFCLLVLSTRFHGICVSVSGCSAGAEA
eukprot:GHVS01025200.1.p1 GENE.GHVS01025200.1~~GHVS01025200.1.p1  ORF type:complete len:530 (-),score=128.96 GHVS01025200.1:458-2047(-)